MADGHFGELCYRLHFAHDGLGCLIVDDPIFQLLNVIFSRVVGMPAFGSDHCGNGTGLVSMFSLISSHPHIVHCGQSQLSGRLIVINLLGEDSVCGFEAIGIERRPGAVVIIGQYESGCVLGA